MINENEFSGMCLKILSQYETPGNSSKLTCRHALKEILLRKIGLNCGELNQFFEITRVNALY